MTKRGAFQGTIGQRALGIRVVRAADGKPLGIGATIIRYILFAVFTCTIIIGIIAAIAGADDPAKQTWMDKAAGSVSVKRP